MCEDCKEMYIIRYNNMFDEYNVQFVNNRMEIIEERLISFSTEYECRKVIDKITDICKEV